MSTEQGASAWVSIQSGNWGAVGIGEHGGGYLAQVSTGGGLRRGKDSGGPGGHSAQVSVEGECR